MKIYTEIRKSKSGDSLYLFVPELEKMIFLSRTEQKLLEFLMKSVKEDSK